MSLVCVFPFLGVCVLCIRNASHIVTQDATIQFGTKHNSVLPPVNLSTKCMGGGNHGDNAARTVFLGIFTGGLVEASGGVLP